MVHPSICPQKVLSTTSMVPKPIYGLLESSFMNFCMDKHPTLTVELKPSWSIMFRFQSTIKGWGPSFHTRSRKSSRCVWKQMKPKGLQLLNFNSYHILKRSWKNHPLEDTIHPWLKKNIPLQVKNMSDHLTLATTSYRSIICSWTI